MDNKGVLLPQPMQCSAIQYNLSSRAFSPHINNYHGIIIISSTTIVHITVCIITIHRHQRRYLELPLPPLFIFSFMNRDFRSNPRLFKLISPPTSKHQHKRWNKAVKMILQGNTQIFRVKRERLCGKVLLNGLCITTGSSIDLNNEFIAFPSSAHLVIPHTLSFCRSRCLFQCVKHKPLSPVQSSNYTTKHTVDAIG